ncbi:MAG: glutamine--fructose-6-phosphate transaminase (isomerizing) [Bacillota bacterium]|nr:glutamine--fructose-6-phosphate transaminase (isomerizing) [Bacillota bacterium]
MCGIIGYTGKKQSVEILLDGLKKMEYRGYDSAGIAVFTDDTIKVIKAKGRLAHLEKKIGENGAIVSTCGIGHTRWATHGEPSDVNSHPHSSENITVVHNGIIENYQQLKEELEKEGYVFLSQTDTEVVAHLIKSLYKGDLFEAVKQALTRITGSYALGIISADNPGTIIAARKDSPLLIGIGKGENFIASDMPAILKYTKQYYLLEEGEIAEITENSIKIYDMDKNEVHKKVQVADWDISSAEKGGYPHFMLKEIFETPRVLKNIANKYLAEDMPHFDQSSEFNAILRRTNRIVIVGCGSAFYVGTVGKYLLESFCGVEATVEAGSEFRYRHPVLRDKDLIVAISQSGETADTLAAIRLAKARGIPVLSIVNVLGSSAARESDIMLYTAAGPEIAVATTKAFSAQLAVFYLLCLQLALVKGRITEAQLTEYVKEFKRLPELCDVLLSKADTCEKIAQDVKLYDNIFFIGRGLDYSLALEGSLKLKEISYIHSEAFSAGELKHGPISLITEQTPTFAIATQKSLNEKIFSNICEIRSRNGRVWSVCRKSDKTFFERESDVITVPDTDDMFMPSLSVIPLQLIAYYASVAKGCDVDKPRNLAKSVTVE